MSNTESTTLQPIDESPETQAANKLMTFLNTGMRDLAPSGIAVASHSNKHVLFNLHFKNNNAREVSDKLGTPWALFCFQVGGTGGSCVYTDANQIQCTVRGDGMSLDKFNRSMDKILSPESKRLG